MGRARLGTLYKKSPDAKKWSGAFTHPVTGKRVVCHGLYSDKQSSRAALDRMIKEAERCAEGLEDPCIAQRRRPISEPFSDDAARMLAVIIRRFNEQGAGMNMSDVARETGITSKRRLLAIVDELERSGRVRTVRLRDRGQPRILEPIASGPSDKDPDTTPGSVDGFRHREVRHDQR